MPPPWILATTSIRFSKPAGWSGWGAAFWRAAPLTARTLLLLGLPGRALVRGVGLGGRLGRWLGVLHLGGIDVPGRALVGDVGVGGSLRLLGSLAGLLGSLARLLGSPARLLR